jgi:hypothetical protein
MVEVARRLCEDNHILVNEIWSYHSIGDQVRFTLVHRSREVAVKRPVVAAPKPAPAARSPKKPARTAPPTRKAPKPKTKTKKPSRAQKRK